MMLSVMPGTAVNACTIKDYYYLQFLCKNHVLYKYLSGLQVGGVWSRC